MCLSLLLSYSFTLTDSPYSLNHLFSLSDSQVAAFWPEDRDSRSSLLNDLFNELWRAFPCFEGDSILSQRIQVGKQRYRFKSYLKHLLYNTIKNKVKKSKKTVRTESPSLEKLQQHKPTEIAWWNQYKNDENCEEILLLE